MNNKLTQDYKDDLYEKVLEKKAKRTVKRKRLASICAIFIIVACFAGYGYTKYEKENYNNYFITETNNIYIDDEYEYFDDLGIKLEFINTDKDSITIGINVKYEDIADYRVGFENVKIIDVDNDREYIINDDIDNKNNNAKYIIENKMFNSSEEMIYILKYGLGEKKDINRVKILIDNITIGRNESNEFDIINLGIEKEISIEN